MLVTTDLDGLEMLLHPGLVYCHSSGDHDDRQSLLDRLARGELRYLTAITEITRIARAGRTAVVHGELSARVVVAGQTRLLHTATIAVWLDDDGWRLIAVDSRRIADG